MNALSIFAAKVLEVMFRGLNENGKNFMACPYNF